MKPSERIYKMIKEIDGDDGHAKAITAIIFLLDEQYEKSKPEGGAEHGKD